MSDNCGVGLNLRKTAHPPAISIQAGWFGTAGYYFLVQFGSTNGFIKNQSRILERTVEERTVELKLSIKPDIIGFSMINYV